MILKAILIMRGFNALFIEVDVDSDNQDHVQLEQEFSPDQLARLDQLEQDHV